METPKIPPTDYLDLLMDAVCIVDPDGRFIYVNAAFERLFGYKPEEVRGKKMIDFVAPEDRERTLNVARAIMSGEPQQNFENTYLRKDGQPVHILWSARWSPEHHVRVAVARDITARKQAERLQAATYALSEAAHVAEDSTRLFDTIYHITSSLMPAGTFVTVLRDSKNGDLAIKFHPDEGAGKGPGLRSAVIALAWHVILCGQSQLLQGDFKTDLPPDLEPLAHSDVRCWLAVPITLPEGPVGALIMASDSDCHCYSDQHRDLLEYVGTQTATAIQRLRLIERLRHLAQYDELTELPNRALFLDRLEHALARANRYQSILGVLFIDLNDFKRVNDSYGHGAGDEVLIVTAERLRECVRRSDTVARMGGDEFVVLLDELANTDCAAAVADKIYKKLSQPIELNREKVIIRPSIGIALFPRDGENARQILRHADDAMYASKRRQDTPA